MRAAMRWSAAVLVSVQALLATEPVSAQRAAARLDVPFIAQSEALCGGAASAMVLRYWGARRVSAEDFASLLNPARDGIETGVLVNALVQRGWRALAFTGTTATVAHHLSRARPVIALIAVAPGRFHYVVVVEISSTTVTYHDPAVRPFQAMALAEFERAWSDSSRWALLLMPGEAVESAQTSTASSPPSPPGACQRSLSEAADAAALTQFARAEQLLEAARITCPSDAAPLRELAALRLLQRRPVDAAALARAAVQRDAADRHAWRILGTAQFLRRDQVSALDAWNHAGEPLNDLVRVDGLERTRHRVVTDRIALDPGELVTPAGLARARRRLLELPAGKASRLDVAPVGGGLVEVHAAVFERSLMPSSRLALGVLGLRALVNREATWQLSSPTGSGERLDVFARWWDQRPAVSVALRAPVRSRLASGVLTVASTVARESFASATAPDGVLVEDSRSAVVGLSDWATANLRWDVAARVDRWVDEPARLGVGAAIERHFGAVAAIRLRGDVWPAGTFGVASLGARWRWSRDGADRLLASATATMASRDGPRALWSGAGTGHGRPLLLRAHPLLDDGVVSGDAFGPRLLHAGIEWRRDLAVPGPLKLQLAVFGDAAAASRADRPSIGHVDTGVGLRLRVPGEGAVRIDVARGLDDGRHALSVAWDLPWPAWP